MLDAGRTDVGYSGVVSERTQMVLLTRYQDGAEVVPASRVRARTEAHQVREGQDQRLPLERVP